MNILKINGKEQTFAGHLPATIMDLLAELKINNFALVAEIDGKIVSQKDFANTKISPGQSIELVHFVGGG